MLTVPRVHSFVQNGVPAFFDLKIAGDRTIRAAIPSLTFHDAPHHFTATGTRDAHLTGVWSTRDGERLFQVETAEFGKRPTEASPIRICCFMTDGYVGNDMQIIDAIQKNAKTTRVFSFGIGNSVNRYLLDGMARAGRGEAEYVLLESDADAAVQRFAQRIQTPVLTDIELTFSDSLKVLDLVPERIADLFDVKPFVLHGRYSAPGRGTLTIRGNTGSGRYERTLDLDLPSPRSGPGPRSKTS
jgi:Ca-activated chloride channel family protein